MKNPVLAENVLKNLREKQIYIRGGWPAPYEKWISISGAPKNILEEFFHEFSLTFKKLLAK